MKLENPWFKSRRIQLAGAFMALALVLALSRSYAAVALAAIILFVVFAVAKPPSRYRRHSWGQIQQAQDHRIGIFGRSYPEDSTSTVRTTHVGRNDTCPCESGKKYKRCCGAA